MRVGPEGRKNLAGGVGHRNTLRLRTNLDGKKWVILNAVSEERAAE